MEEDSAGFGELLRQAEQLTAEIDDTGLPRVKRNLKQIVKEGHQLWSRTALLSAKDTNDVKASILLGSRGFDLPRASQKLEGLAAAPTFEPVEEVRDTDIQAFLRNERENAILSVFAESVKSTQEEVVKFYLDAFSNEWQREKQRLLDSLVGPSNEVMDVSTAAEPSLSSSTFQLDPKTRSTMTAAEVAYAREVYLYNEGVIKGGTRPKLAERFKAVSKEIDDRHAMDMWDMVCTLLEAPLSSTERADALVNQSRKYLERVYDRYMRAAVVGNLGRAALGGGIDTVNLVKGFLRVKSSKLQHKGEYDGNLDGQPVWALIYYCLRCGDRRAAVEISKNAAGSAAELCPYLEEYASSEDGHLRASSESKIRLQYIGPVHASTDPFKRAVFCILARCDVTQDHPLVSTTCEDYLWLKLCLVRVENPTADEEQQEQAPDRLTLSKLQHSLLEEYGESHFDAMHQPYLYFQVLFLTGQFEHAVDFLARMEPQRCHAVHVALVLYEENLLTPPASVQLPLVSKAPSGHGYCFNLARLVTSYTRKFEVTDPREALGYYYFLRNIKGIRGENLFVACVSELVLETKEFGALLGKTKPDGCRMPGAVDLFHFDTEQIIETVAGDCENRGLYEEAVSLYDLCRKNNDAIRLLNKLLAQHVTSASGPAWERLQNLAVDLATRYRDSRSTASAESLAALYLLLDLGTFFAFVHQKKSVFALDTIRKLDLIPFQPSDVDKSVTAFSQRSEEVRRILPDILLAVLNLLYGEYKELKAAEEGTKKELRSQARAVVMFAGGIPYGMPGDTYARLTQMEALMS
uniref:Nuclear pore protein n=1 Tax=Amblyomma triste TaxID=251400 RepID=A0A023GM45_AMBTT